MEVRFDEAAFREGVKEAAKAFGLYVMDCAGLMTTQHGVIQPVSSGGRECVVTLYGNNRVPVSPGDVENVFHHFDPDKGPDLPERELAFFLVGYLAGYCQKRDEAQKRGVLVLTDGTGVRHYAADGWGGAWDMWKVLGGPGVKGQYFETKPQVESAVWHDAHRMEMLSEWAGKEGA